MGRGGHLGCNRTRLGWGVGVAAAVVSGYILLQIINGILVLVFYGMIGFVAYSKRELLSSYCGPSGEPSRLSPRILRSAPRLREGSGADG